MFDSVRPHRWQPLRLPRPWDSLGKNTGVGCHFLLQCMKVKRESEVTQSCLTLSDPMDCSLPGSSVHGISQARVLEWGAIAFSDPDLGWGLNPPCFPDGSDSKESTYGCRRPGFDPWLGKISWRREWPPTPVFLPREFQGQKSQEGYRLEGHKESDTTE